MNVSPTGGRRGVACIFAAATGLRRSEMAALRWADIDLEAGTVTVRPTVAKNREEAVQPLPPGTVAALRLHRGTQAPGAATFPHVPSTKGLRADLKAAGLAYTTEAGTLDLHALRVTFATLLARSGVSLAQAQRLMRHSTPALTANVYTKLRIEDGHAAVARIDGASTKEQRARPT